MQERTLEQNLTILAKIGNMIFNKSIPTVYQKEIEDRTFYSLLEGSDSYSFCKKYPSNFEKSFPGVWLNETSSTRIRFNKKKEIEFVTQVIEFDGQTRSNIDFELYEKHGHPAGGRIVHNKSLNKIINEYVPILIPEYTKELLGYEPNKILSKLPKK